MSKICYKHNLQHDDREECFACAYEKLQQQLAAEKERADKAEERRLIMEQNLFDEKLISKKLSDDIAQLRSLNSDHIDCILSKDTKLKATQAELARLREQPHIAYLKVSKISGEHTLSFDDCAQTQTITKLYAEPKPSPEVAKLQAHCELYAAEMSEAKAAGFYSASELYSAYKTLQAKLAERERRDAEQNQYGFIPEFKKFRRESCGCLYAEYDLQLTDCGGEFEGDAPKLYAYPIDIESLQKRIAELEHKLAEHKATVKHALSVSPINHIARPDGTGVMVVHSILAEQLKMDKAELESLLQQARKEENEMLNFVLLNSAFLYEKKADSGAMTYQLWSQDEDENFFVLHDEDEFFATPKDAVMAAIRARMK